MNEENKVLLRESIGRINYILFPAIRVNNGKNYQPNQYFYITKRFLVRAEIPVTEENHKLFQYGGLDENGNHIWNDPNMFDFTVVKEDGSPMGECRVILHYENELNSIVNRYLIEKQNKTVLTYHDAMMDSSKTNFDMFAKHGVYQDMNKNTQMNGLSYVMINGEDMRLGEIPF